MKKYKSHLIVFLITFVVLLIIFGLLNAGFNLKKIILYSDLQIEYYPFLKWLKYALNNGSILYSFSNGLGDSMIGLLSYYLLSPINLLVLLYKDAYIMDAAFLIILIKISLSSLTMYTFLRYHFNSEDKLFIILSVIYSLCAYSICYYFNILWLDSFYMLPLVIYALERLIKENKVLLYIILLSYTIITSYYIGYMICIFLCIYFMYYILLNYSLKDKKEVFLITLRFIICSILSGLLCSFILIPTYYDLTLGYRLNESTFNLDSGSSLFEVLGRLLFGSSNNEALMNYNLPAIYTSLLTLPLVYVYLIKSKMKEKIVSISLIVLMCLPFFVLLLNYIWHGFNYPYFFNYRFTFIISFMLIIFAYRGFKMLNKVKWIDWVTFLAIFMIVCTLLMFKNYGWIPPINIIINIGIMILYLLVLLFIKRKKVLLLSILVILELILNGYMCFKDYNFDYRDAFLNREYVLSNIIDEVDREDNDFYRVEKTFYNKLDDNYIYGNYGMTTFSSTIKMDIVKFVGRTGIRSASNDLFYTAASSPLLNSILNFKYLFVIGQIENEAYKNIYETVSFHTFSDEFEEEYGNNYLPIYTYLNSHPLSLGFMVDNTIKDEIVLSSGYDYQKKVFSNMIGKESEALVEIEKNDGEYILDKNADIYYLNIKLKDVDRDDTGYLVINGDIFSEITAFTPNIFILPSDYYNTKLNIDIVCNKGKFSIDETSLYGYYNDKFNEEVSLLEKNIMNVLEFNETYIKGEVNSNGKILFTSIPYNDGWSVFVDGKKVESIKLLDAFIGVELSEGKHIVEFKFFPKGLLLGIVISTIDLFGIILYIILRKK